MGTASFFLIVLCFVCFVSSATCHIAMAYTGYNIRTAKGQLNQPSTIEGGCGNKTAPWGLNGYGFMNDGDKVRVSHTACPLLQSPSRSFSSCLATVLGFR